MDLRESLKIEYYEAAIAHFNKNRYIYGFTMIIEAINKLFTTRQFFDSNEECLEHFYPSGGDIIEKSGEDDNR